MNPNSIPDFDLTIVGGTVITTLDNGSVKELKTDVGIQAGKITEIGNLESRSSKQKISATGLHVIPGVIDTQVHFREPGMTHKEDFESGTRGALLGGVTSVFEMPNTIPATTTLQAINDKVQSAKSKAWVNMAFYVGASSENISELNQLEYAAGCCGVKIFMGSSTGSLLVEDDETLLKVLKNGKRRVAVHCEDEYRLRERKPLALEGKHASYHPIWRDEESALRATTRIVKLAKEARRPVHVLHVNSSDEIEFLAAHKNIASVEVLPQHLTLFAPDCYERLGNYAQQNPPIRTKEHLEALWNALQKGVVDIIGSDHAPHTHEEKSREYPQSPSGMPGVQTLLPIMLNHVNNGKLSLEHLVRLVAHNPVRLFGIKNKGHIRKGFDADLTLVDLKLHRRIENSWIASRSGWTPFDGMQVTGWPKGTIIHGQLKMFEDQVIGSHTGEILEFDF